MQEKKFYEYKKHLTQFLKWFRSRVGFNSTLSLLNYLEELDYISKIKYTKKTQIESFQILDEPEIFLMILIIIKY